NRMGQDIPGAEESDELVNAEFNSPFEEFSLVMELRNSRYESPGMIITQRPLAIYVPSERLELWRIGRKEYKMQSKVENHTEVELDMFRSYAVLYEWVKGIDAAQAREEGFLQERDMTTLTLKAEKEMKNKGFIVRDRKPHHIIVRARPDGDLAMASEGKILYAIIDYELLERTPEREAAVKKVKRLNYLKKQKERFSVIYDTAFPPQLKHMNILGVDYIYGHVESTNGSLWVVGKDPDLFDYFLPERWESTPRTKLSASHDIYHTLTKDNINLVWKISQVGIQPDVDPFKEDERKILSYGYNSPFEEVSIAMELTFKGIRTIYPRAVYMFGKTEHISDFILHESRYLSHQPYRTPDDEFILRKDHKYVIIWGYWNGPDDRLATQDGDYLEGINALSAYREGLLNQDEYITLCRRKKERLEAVGIEDLNLRGTHLLLSLDSSGTLVKDHEGIPEMRVCNFELLKRID
ncbi:MAG TPA: hypothetical protein VMX75_04080, partial [Spirochaetia bacterium]|nr:hypothetical protein [Spirochaetia bacterium]